MSYMRSLRTVFRSTPTCSPIYSAAPAWSSTQRRSLSQSAPSATSTSAAAASTTPPSKLSEGEQALKDKLETALQGAKVEVQDVSGGCGSFYAISIAHESFKGLNTMKQHRIVNGLLADEIKGMHGLQLKTSAE